MLSLSLAQLRAHAGRLLATCLAIVIAVGFVVATLVLNETTNATVSAAVAAPYVGAAAVITADPPGGPVLDTLTSTGGRTALLARIRLIEGVRDVAADARGGLNVQLPGSQRQFALLTAVAADPSLQWQRLASGRLPSADGEVAVAQHKGIRVGSTLTLDVEGASGPAAGGGRPAEGAGRPARTATVVGVLDLSGALGGAGLQLFATAPQARAWGATEVQAIRVSAAPAVAPAVLATRLQRALNSSGPAGFVVRTGAEEAALRVAGLSHGATGLLSALLAFAAIAVLVCALVIANTFAVLLTQRVRELALLRCVGATAGQLRRGVLVESLAIGALASLGGVAAGILLAAVVSALAGRFGSPIPLSGLSVSARTVAIGLALGILVTALAASLPARRASRVSPLAALRPMAAAPARGRAGLLRRATGLLLLIPGALVLGYAARDGRLLIAVAGGGVSFVAVLLLAQWLVPPVVALAGRIGGAAGGVPGRLAAANALQNPQRTAATATALIIGVTLTTAMVVGAASTKATTSALIDDAFATDLIVRDGGSAGLPAGLAGSIARVAGVRTALALPGATLRATGKNFTGTVLGIDAAAASSVVRSPAGAGVARPGTISVPAYLASSWGAEGAPVTLASGPHRLTLRMHVVRANAALSITAADLALLAPGARPEAIWVRLVDGTDAEGRSAVLSGIDAAVAEAGSSAEVRSSYERRDSYQRVIDTLLLIVLGLLAVAVVIAVIGVGNTTALCVLERAQESALLRALGLTRGQLRWMLLAEAVLIAGVAAVLGVVLGGVYGAFGAQAALTGAGRVRIDVPWGQLLLIITVATGTGGLAAVLPSRRAARISPVAAIAA